MPRIRAAAVLAATQINLPAARLPCATGSTRRWHVKIVTLEDGSRVQLNAGTAIAKDFSGGQRRLTFLKGEALFEVAPDPSRPFTVEAAGAVPCPS